MKNFISVYKNVIASNNKRNWVDPNPAIQVSKTKSVIGCGAKVAIITEYETEVIE